MNKHFGIVSFQILSLALLFACGINSSNGFCAEPEFGFQKIPTTLVGRVEKVKSADSFVLATGERVRLIGLKAPQPPRRPQVEHDENGLVIEQTDVTDTLEDRAFEFACSLLEGKEVRLEFDTDKKDQDFYLLAYVFLTDNDTFVNTEILRQGYASLSLNPNTLKYQNELRAAYREAREEKRGLHEDN